MKARLAPLALSFPSASTSQLKFLNLMALENRLRLVEAFRLQQRQSLDASALEAMRLEWKRPATDTMCIKKTITYIPGALESACEEDSEIELSIPFDSLTAGCTEAQKRAFRLLLASKLNNLTGMIQIKTKRFPFWKQNLEFTIGRIASVVKWAKENSETKLFEQVPEDLFALKGPKPERFSFEKVLRLA
jgi:hypothetical protein